MRTVDWYFFFEGAGGDVAEYGRSDDLASLPDDGFLFGIFLHDDGTARNIQGNLLYYVWMHDAGEIACGQTLRFDESEAVVQAETEALKVRYPKAHIMRGRDVPDGMMARAQELAEEHKAAHRALLNK